MKSEQVKGKVRNCLWILPGMMFVFCLVSGGCDREGMNGYSNEWLYPENVSSVYVEMFDSASLRRGHEFDLTDALAKMIESRTPYKIISDRSRADTVLSGRILSIGQEILTFERQTGSTIEQQYEIRAVVNWKNLNTGEILIDGLKASGSASFSTLQNQGTKYASSLATNRLAEQIIEMMQKTW